MRGNKQAAKILAAIGLVAGIAAVVYIVIVGDTFGYPGSAAYRTYETFNRAIAVIIALEASALVAFYLHKCNSLPRIDRILIIIALVAWFGMAVGTAAEFWLFSDLPYAAANMRSLSFSVFSFSSLIAGIALFVLGLRILLGRQLPFYFGVVLILYLPVDVLLFVIGQSIFLASALITIAIAGFALVWAAVSRTIQQEAA